MGTAKCMPAPTAFHSFPSLPSRAFSLEGKAGAERSRKAGRVGGVGPDDATTDEDDDWGGHDTRERERERAARRTINSTV